jgi:hypothetical protein
LSRSKVHNLLDWLKFYANLGEALRYTAWGQLLLAKELSKNLEELRTIDNTGNFRSLAILGQAEGPKANTLKPEPLIYDYLFLPCLFLPA